MTKITFKKLILENFRIHQNFEIDFSENKLCTVVGKNGSGKSSILDSLMWCLYDETLRGIKGDKVVNNSIGKDCCVKINFTIDDIEYDVHNYRKHSKFKNTKQLFRNGKLISTDADVKSTNDIINNIIMPKDLFMNCLVFSLYNKDPFTERTHSGQKEILDRMLSLEKYDEYYNKITEEIKKLELTTTSLNPEYFETEEEKLKIEINEYKNKEKDEIDEYTKEIEQIKTNIKEIEDEINKNEKNISKIDQKKIINENNEINNKIKETNELILKLKEEQLNKISELNDKYKNKFDIELDKQTQKLKEESKGIELSIPTIEKECEEKKNEIVSIKIDLTNEYDKRVLANKNIINEIEKEYEENLKKISISDKLTEIKLKINDLTSKNTIINNNINNLNLDNKKIVKERDELNSSKVCTVCKRPFDKDTHQHINEKISELKNVFDKNTNDIKELNETIKINNNEKEKLNLESNKLLKNYEEKEKELLEIKNKEISKNEKSLLEYKEKLNNKLKLLKDQFDSTIQEYNSKKENLFIKNQEILQEIDKIQKDLRDSLSKSLLEDKNKLKEKYETKINDNNEKINKYNEKINTNNEILNKINSVMEDIRLQKSFIENNNNQIKNKEEYINNRKNDYKKMYNLYDKKINELNIQKMEYFKNELEKNEKIEILKFWKKAFSDVGIKSIILDECIPILSKRAKELSKLTNDIRVSFSSQTALKSGKLNNKFNINAIHSQNLSEYNEFSAGETRITDIIVLLCLRYLLEYMAGKNINILFLDEILDASLDELNSEIVLQMIEQISKEYFVMIITHTQKSKIMSDIEIRL